MFEINEQTFKGVQKSFKMGFVIGDKYPHAS